MFLIFDTETTGLPNHKLANDHKDQAHICQLAAMLVDTDNKIRHEMNCIIRPDSWTIGERAAEVHGISQQDAQLYGIPLKAALGMFQEMLNLSEIAVAHNFDFDAKMLKIEGVQIVKKNIAP